MAYTTGSIQYELMFTDIGYFKSFISKTLKFNPKIQIKFMELSVLQTINSKKLVNLIKHAKSKIVYIHYSYRKSIQET